MENNFRKTSATAVVTTLCQCSQTMGAQVDLESTIRQRRFTGNWQHLSMLCIGKWLWRLEVGLGRSINVHIFH